MLGVWPAVLVAGVAFAVPQFLVSNFHGPWLVDIVAARGLDGRAGALSRVWQPRQRTGRMRSRRAATLGADVRLRRVLSRRRRASQAWMPWIILSVAGLPLGPAADVQGAGSTGVSIPALPGAAACTSHGAARAAGGRRRAGPRRRCSRSTGCRPPAPAILLAAIIAGLADGLLAARSWLRDLLAHAPAGALLAAHDRRDAGARLRDAVLRHRRHARPGLRPAPACSIRSSAPCSAGSAWR